MINKYNVTFGDILDYFCDEIKDKYNQYQLKSKYFFNNGELTLPIRYNRKFMERLNKRENEMLERRNLDLELFNRPRLENPFYDEEKNNNKKDVEILLKILPNSKIENKTDLKCIICLSGFRIGDKEVTLPCLHMFHFNCIKKWFYENRWCPLCKSEIYV